MLWHRNKFVVEKSFNTKADVSVVTIGKVFTSRVSSAKTVDPQFHFKGMEV